MLRDCGPFPGTGRLPKREIDPLADVLHYLQGTRSNVSQTMVPMQCEPYVCCDTDAKRATFWPYCGTNAI
eukprot:scaffold25750_cov23-Tisochrysis_lutea.AAC.4